MPLAQINKKVLNFLNRRRKQLIKASIWLLVVYLLFFCPVTRPTWEGLIDLLSNRNPPAWLMPSQPGEKTDVQQTKIYKRQKLAQFKVKVNLVNEDIKHLGKISRLM